jgi:hypothetical protein
VRLYHYEVRRESQASGFEAAERIKRALDHRIAIPADPLAPDES